MMPFVLAIVDLLKTIAWPLVVMIVAIYYKTETIKDLLPRLRKAGPTGVEFDPAAQQKTIASDIVASSSELKQKNNLLPPTPAISQVESKLADDLKKIDPGDQIALLTRELAVARLIVAFERIYRVLFGSQIYGLRRLNEVQKATIADAHALYETFRSQTPSDYPISFDVWIGFLKNQELVKENNGTVEITDIGRDFLLYITQNRLIESKPF